MFHSRALAPNLIEFAYIPAGDLRVLENSVSMSLGRRGNSPDFSYGSAPGFNGHEDEHVLVLNLPDKSRGTKSSGSRYVVTFHEKVILY